MPPAPTEILLSLYINTSHHLLKFTLRPYLFASITTHLAEGEYRRTSPSCQCRSWLRVKTPLSQVSPSMCSPVLQTQPPSFTLQPVF